MTSQLVSNPELPGLNTHPVGDFLSYSPPGGLRVLGVGGPSGPTLVHADLHDKAYEWGARHSAVLADNGSLLVVVPTSSKDAVSRPSEVAGRRPSRFAALPKQIAELLEGTDDESEFLGVTQCLSPEWQEIALNAFFEVDQAPLPSNIIAVDDAMLEFALRLPEERWRVFLHPRQRDLIEAPIRGHLLLKGGPGTGKTVCLVHRFVRLSRDTSVTKPPLLVALNPAARTAIEQLCVSLNYEPDNETIVSGTDLPKSVGDLEEHFGNFSSVLIDEGQDLPIDFIRNLLNLLESQRHLPSLVIAFDPNQAIVQPTGDALHRLVDFCDQVTLRYCYRSTSEIVGLARSLMERLHGNYAATDHENRHYIDASRDETTQTVTALSGPETRTLEVSSDEVVGTALAECSRLYDDGLENPVAILVAGSKEDFKAAESILLKGLPDLTVRDVKSSKGLEFRHGVVVDLLKHDPEMNNRLTRHQYQRLAELYVAVTRFSVSLTCVAGPDSPLVAE